MVFTLTLPLVECLIGYFLHIYSALMQEHILYDALGKVSGRYPDWTFTDRANPTEQLRRINVVRLFLSAFGKAKRAIPD